MENFFTTDMDEIYIERERQLEELSKNPPSDITFTYSKEQIENAITNFRTEIEKRKNEIRPSSGYVLEDYREEWTDNQPTSFDVVNIVDSYNKLVNKNNINDVSSIVSRINSAYNDRMQLPNEITKTISEIKEHYAWLQQMSEINRYVSEKQAEQFQQQQAQAEQLQQQQEQQIQQARYNEIKSKLPIINEQLNRIRELPKNSDIYETIKNELLRERLYFYHKVNSSAEYMINGNRKSITQEDIDRLNNYIATLDSIEQEIVNSNQQTQQQVVEEPQVQQEPTQQVQEQEQINQLKTQISAYDTQIATLLSSVQPYMQIPKVNQEISKVVAKNNEIDSSQIINSLQDYKTVVEIKQTLVTYLEQANKFIKDNVEKQQRVVQPQQVQEQPTQPLSEELWKDFEQPQGEQKPQQPLPDNFWDEFDNPKNNIRRPERKFNDDGTYTMEYMAYLAATSPGIEKQVYEQMQQRNDQIRANNKGITSQQADAMIQAMVNGEIDTNGQIITKNENNIYNRNMGFTKIGILTLLTSIVSIIIMILGIVLIS